MVDLDKFKKIIDYHDINISEHDVLDMLRNFKRWPMFYPWGQCSVEIVNNLGTNAVDFYKAYNNKGNALYLDFDRWHKYYELGYTTIISNVFDLNGDLRSLSKDLTEATGVVLNANFYFSKPGQAASFPPHTHKYDVIVKQIYGESPWSINGEKKKLKPQETVIVPAGYLHSVDSKDDKKLSLTINIE